VNFLCKGIFIGTAFAMPIKQEFKAFIVKECGRLGVDVLNRILVPADKILP